MIAFITHVINLAAVIVAFWIGMATAIALIVVMAFAGVSFRDAFNDALEKTRAARREDDDDKPEPAPAPYKIGRPSLKIETAHADPKIADVIRRRSDRAFVGRIVKSTPLVDVTEITWLDGTKQVVSITRVDQRRADA